MQLLWLFGSPIPSVITDVSLGLAIKRTDPGFTPFPGATPTLLVIPRDRIMAAARRHDTYRLFKITASFNGSNTIVGLRDHRREGR